MQGDNLDWLDLEETARKFVCHCGSVLLVAYNGDLVLRCPTHGYSPDMKRRDLRGLKQLFADGMALSALEAQTLHHQMYRELSRAEDNGRRPSRRTVLLFEKLERILAGEGRNDTGYR